jgi:peptide/nickel transport system substrate-binding protein
VLAGAAILGISGCGGGCSSAPTSSGTPERGGTLRVSQGEEILTLAPLEALDPSSLNVVSQINEPLFRVNGSGDNEPLLAAKVTKSSDQKVWTIGLRRGVDFSDGKPMTSADVLFTLEEARKSPVWESLFSGVTKIEAKSPSTIVITNRKPAPELEAILSQWSFGIVPKNYAGESEKEFAENPIGTGPFQLASWKKGESVTLDKNKHYWQQGKPYLDQVRFQTVPNPESRVSQLAGGQLNLIYGPPSAQLDSIESSPDLEVGEYPLGYVQWLGLNQRSELFANPKARDAVYWALDREGIVSTALSGHGEVAGAWIPPVVPYSDKSIQAPSQNLDKAKALLAEAEKEGADPTFTIINDPSASFWETAVQVVQQNLEEAGFKVKIRSLDLGSLAEVRESGEYDLSTFEGYSAIPSPSELFALYNSF